MEEVAFMKIMKRSGIEADFDVTKISAAIKKANCEVAAVDQLSEEQIEEISTNVEKICCLLYTSPSPRDGLLSRMPSSA